MTRAERPVVRCDKATMEILETFPSIAAANKKYGYYAGKLTYSCARRLLGDEPWVWRYADDYDPNETFKGKLKRPVAVYDSVERTLNVFPTIKSASKALGAAQNSVSSAMTEHRYLFGRYVLKYAR